LVNALELTRGILTNILTDEESMVFYVRATIVDLLDIITAALVVDRIKELENSEEG
jgi:hypothetical protein